MALRPNQLPILDRLSQSAFAYLEKLIDEELSRKFCIYDREIKLEIIISKLESEILPININMINLPAVLTELTKKCLSKGWLAVSFNYYSQYLVLKLMNPRPRVPVIISQDNK